MLQSHQRDKRNPDFFSGIPQTKLIHESPFSKDSSQFHFPSLGRRALISLSIVGSSNTLSQYLAAFSIPRRYSDSPYSRRASKTIASQFSRLLPENALITPRAFVEGSVI